MIDRYWFFTWRTYGTWLPGEDGFVGFYRRLTGERIIDHVIDGDFADPMPALAAHARGLLKSEPILLDLPRAETLLTQFHETATYRGWQIDAVAILTTHAHIVFGVPGDPDPSRMLGDWKSYGSRALNRRFGRQPEWWAERGSKRRLKTALSRWGAIRYVRDQENPLLVWLSDDATAILADLPPT
jgi:REP element-mobilizing transposase RayT